MAAFKEILVTTTTSGAMGTYFYWWGSTTNLQTAMASVNTKGFRTYCSDGNHTSSTHGISDFTAAAYPNIASVRIYSYNKRSGTVGNASDEHMVDRSGSGDWWTGAEWASTGAYHTETVTAPAGGWTLAKVNALRWKMYHNKGAQTSTNYIQWDLMEIWIDWDWFVPDTISASDSGVSDNGADLDGSFNANGDGDCEYRFQVTSVQGDYSGDSPSWETDAGETGTVTCNQRSLSGLASGTQHWYRLAVRNEGDVVYTSAEGTFTTNAGSAGLIVLF